MARRAPFRKPVSQVHGSLGLYTDGTLFSLEDSEPGECRESAWSWPSTTCGTRERWSSWSRHFYLALKEDGTVWYWVFLGRTEDDQKIYQEIPAQVPVITGAVDISADQESLIRTASGDLFVFNTESLQVEKIPFR